jgi:PTS system N-acetylglucosamine-specific IIC component
MKYLQKLGKSLMLPVACLPVAAILMGIGYWIDPTGWGANSAVAGFLIKAGGAIVDNMAILFAIGVGVGMSKDGEGTAALAALISWLMIQTLLSPGAYAMFTGIAVADVPAAFGKLNNQFIGIVSGVLGAACYNKFSKTKLPDAIAFFSGRRCVAIITAGATLVVVLALALVWPLVYNGLVSFGELIVTAGPVGAGIYGFLNRILIPVGLHHALNSVFWFDVAGINDLGKFWSASLGGIKGQTGMYMTGFFPVMMFGLPAACLAMVHTAKTAKKKIAASLLFSGSVAAFFVGITEPIEFAFMFLAPPLYAVHAVLTGTSLAICAALPVRCGFNFSAGLVDWFLSFKAPMAVNPFFVIPIGLVYSVIYYVVFRFLITKFNFKTPGREEDDESSDEEKNVTVSNDFTKIAEICIAGLGGKANIVSTEYCATRLRTEIRDPLLVDEKHIKTAGIAGVIRPGKNSVQVIIGTKVQFVADEVTRLLASNIEIAASKKLGDSAPEAPMEKAAPKKPIIIDTSKVDKASAKKILAPVAGMVKAICESIDPAHQSEALGKGVCVMPEGGKIFAPFDGKVDMIFDTKHAINLLSHDGVELLIHCGIDTVKLGGKGFTMHIAEGDAIKTGQLLFEYDQDVISRAGYSLETQVVVTNTDAYKAITQAKAGTTAVGDVVLYVE